LTRPDRRIRVTLRFNPRVTRFHDSCPTVVGDLEETVDSVQPTPKKSTFLITDAVVCKDGTWKLAVRHQTRIPEHKEEVVIDPKLLRSAIFLLAVGKPLKSKFLQAPSEL
jgi:hypothetical protein